MKLSLKREAPDGHRAVEPLTREAFWNLNSPGCCEHYLIHVLRASQDFILKLDFVVQARGKYGGRFAARCRLTNCGWVHWPIAPAFFPQSPVFDVKERDVERFDETFPKRTSWSRPLRRDFRRF